MGIEGNKELERQFIDKFNKGNFDAIYEIEHPDSVFHVSPEVEIKGGPEGFKQVITTLKSTFPDLHISLEDMIAEGDTLVTRYTMTGTHTGEDYMGIPATGKRFEFEGVMIQRFEDGKVVKRWEYLDRLDVLHQRGVIPSLEEIQRLQKQKQTEEENKQVVLRLIEEMDKGNIAIVDELTTSDFVMHRIGDDTIDKEMYKEFHQRAYAAMPDYKMTIDEIISEGDKVSVRANRSFTQKRYPKGISATGNIIKVATYVYFRLEGEKIAEGWVLRDNLSYYQQHGVLPSNEEIESRL